YQSKLNPLVGFGSALAAVNKSYNDVYNSSGVLVNTAAWPTDYSQLPTVSLVVPDQLHDMHNGTIAQADTWLKSNLDAYVQWTYAHNSLFILTWDEDDSAHSNRIVTLFIGPMVAPGQYSETINHY